MCEECGCHNHTHDEVQRIPINRSVTEVNDIIADQISESLREKHIFCINLMGSPGSGKTTVIEGLSTHINPADIAVIQGDLESDVDTRRLEEHNIQTFQINTHSGCHLNSTMINKILLDADLHDKKYVFIENVGNLVCPAGVKIGQHFNIVVSSTTEGSDKPKKYPIIFLDAQVIVISKYDLSEIVEFDEHQYINDINHINSNARIVKTSSKQPETYKELAEIIEHNRQHFIGEDHTH